MGRDAIDTTDGALAALQEALATKAMDHATTVMPGFTHLQVAQPVTFGHHLLAYVEMLSRDRGRFADARTRLNEMPLGAAALAGTVLPDRPRHDGRGLGLRPPGREFRSTPFSDRDFVVEALAASSLTAIHLSRFAEEIVIWSSAQFNFIKLSDKFSTGSSIMPQKRNPDAAELVRAKSGRIIGALTGMLVVLKGLPLTYAKDMQEDKEPVFDAFASLILAIPRHRRHGRRHDGQPERHEEGREHRLRDRHRPRRLAGAEPRYAVPPSPRGHGSHRLGCREASGAARKAADRRDAGDRAQNHHRCLRRAGRPPVGEKPHSYGGTAPENVRREGPPLAERLGKEAATKAAT